LQSDPDLVTIPATTRTLLDQDSTLTTKSAIQFAQLALFVLVSKIHQQPPVESPPY